MQVCNAENNTIIIHISKATAGYVFGYVFCAQRLTLLDTFDCASLCGQNIPDMSLVAKHIHGLSIEKGISDIQISAADDEQLESLVSFVKRLIPFSDLQPSVSKIPQIRYLRLRKAVTETDKMVSVTVRFLFAQYAEACNANLVSSIMSLLYTTDSRDSCDSHGKPNLALIG